MQRKNCFRLRAAQSASLMIRWAVALEFIATMAILLLVESMVVGKLCFVYDHCYSTVATVMVAWLKPVWVIRLLSYQMTRKAQVTGQFKFKTVFYSPFLGY